AVRAYDGGTPREEKGFSGGRFKSIVSLGPEPVNYPHFTASVGALASSLSPPRRTLPFAIVAMPGRLMIDPSGLPSATLGSGSHEVECVTLDQFLPAQDIRPTFIKMDIEGAEPAALRGSRETIVKHRPILAICAYHEQNHLWKIPLMIA